MDPEALTILERGFIFAALADGPRARICFDQLAPAQRDRCVAAYEDVLAATPSHRRAVTVQLSRQLFSSLPEGLERVHPWRLRELVQNEPPAVQALVVNALPAPVSSQVGLWAPKDAPGVPVDVGAFVLAAVFAQLEPLPPRDPAPPFRPLARWAQLTRWPEKRITTTLTHLGCLILGALLCRVPPALAQALENQFRPPFSQKIQAARQATDLPYWTTLSPPPRDGRTPEMLLFDLGCQAVAPCLGTRTRRQLGQLLPRELSQLVSQHAGRPPAADTASLLIQFNRADAWGRGETL